MTKRIPATQHLHYRNKKGNGDQLHLNSVVSIAFSGVYYRKV